MWCAVWMGFLHPVNFSLQILELGVLPLRKVWIYIITQNKYFGEPPDCAASVTHTPNISWMPSPPCFPLLIGQVNAKSVLLLSAIFHRFSRKYFIVHFFCLTNPNNVCVLHTVIHMALVWLGKMDFSQFLPVVINYTDIVLAQSAGGLLDSFGGSSKVGLWNLISVLDFYIPLRDPSGALFCLCRLGSAGIRRALAMGEQPM